MSTILKALQKLEDERRDGSPSPSEPGSKDRDAPREARRESVPAARKDAAPGPKPQVASPTPERSAPPAPIPSAPPSMRPDFVAAPGQPLRRASLRSRWSARVVLVGVPLLVGVFVWMLLPAEGDEGLTQKPDSSASGLATQAVTEPIASEPSASRREPPQEQALPPDEPAARASESPGSDGPIVFVDAEPAVSRQPDEPSEPPRNLVSQVPPGGDPGGEPGSGPRVTAAASKPLTGPLPAPSPPPILPQAAPSPPPATRQAALSPPPATRQAASPPVRKETAPTPPPAVAKPRKPEPREPARSPIVAALVPPKVRVERTIWHPKPERRSALVHVQGHKEALELKEGDAVGTLVVAEIQPSGVVFLHGGVRLRHRVGE